MEVWKIIFLSKWVICRFHVNLPGCTKKSLLVGGFNPFGKQESNWIISPGIGLNIKIIETINQINLWPWKWSHRQWQSGKVAWEKKGTYFSKTRWPFLRVNRCHRSQKTVTKRILGFKTPMSLSFLGGDNFFCCFMEWYTPVKTNECPLKNSAWKTILSFWKGSFSGRKWLLVSRSDIGYLFVGNPKWHLDFTPGCRPWSVNFLLGNIPF